MQRPSKRRRQQVPDSAGLDWARPAGDAQSTLSLSVTGSQCTLFDGGDFEPEEHLMPWHGAPETLVDRFDGRLLLEGLQKPRVDSWDQLPPELEDCTAEELEAERFADLDPSREAELEHIAGWFTPAAAAHDSDDEEDAAVGDGPGSSFAAVGFSYGSAAASGSEGVPPVAEDEPLAPRFSIPEGLAAPQSARQHKIMVQTARFVRGAGRQSVFVLRVKQAGNPHFTFLSPGDRLHAYFEWLLTADLDALEAAQAAAPLPASPPAGAPSDGDALGLLSAYDEEGSPPPEQPPPQPQLAAGPSQPPPEVQAIVARLVRFVQKSGAQFEASLRAREAGNPRFGFLRPGHHHHAYYRAQLAQALGEAAAAAILPPLPADQPAADQQGAASNGAAEASQSQQPVSTPRAGSALRANPSLVKVVLRPLTQEKATGKPAADDAEAAAAGGTSPVAGQAAAEPRPAEAAPAQAGSESAADELELPEAEAPASGAAASAAADEEERKARRRLLARQLLLKKQQQEQPPAAAPTAAAVPGRITDHRSAFLAEDASPGKQQAAQLRSSAGHAPAQPAAPQLPQLEELLRAKRAAPATALSELEVLPAAEAAGAEDEAGASAAEVPTAARRKDKHSKEKHSRRRARSRSRDSSSDERRRRRRSSSRKRERERERRKDSGRSKSKSKASKRRRASPSPEPAPAPPLEAPEVLEARIRAMLRGEQ